MHSPIVYADRHRAEPIILEAINRRTQDIAHLAAPELDRLKQRFFIEEPIRIEQMPPPQPAAPRQR